MARSDDSNSHDSATSGAPNENGVWADDLPLGVRGLLAIYDSLPSASLRASARGRITELLKKKEAPGADSLKGTRAPDVAQLSSWKNELEKSLVFDEEIAREFGDAANRKREQVRAIDTLLNALSEDKEEGSAGRPAKQSPVSSGSTQGSHVKVPPPDRSVDSNRFTPVHLYWPAILASVIELGGRAPKEQIIESVERRLGGILTHADREMLPSGVDVRWKNRAAWQRLNMIKLGLLRNDSLRGIWEITDAGRQWLEDFQKKTRN